MKKIVDGYLDNDCYKVILGGPEVAAKLSDFKWDHITYTGNNVVAKHVMRKASEHLTPLLLEFGGKNPYIVTQTANVDMAAKNVVVSRLVNGGQVCLCSDYVFVHSSIKDDFVNKVVANIRERYGTDIKNNKDLTRLVSQRHASRVKSLLDDAVAKGAKVVVGGATDITDRFVEPAILVDVSETAKINEEEVFGPVLVIKEFDDLDDVITYVNHRDKSLTLALFTNSQADKDKITKETSSGSLVNDATIKGGRASEFNGFGGVGASGMGRYFRKHSFETFSHRKTVLDMPAHNRYHIDMGAPYTEDKMKLSRASITGGKTPPLWMVKALFFIRSLFKK